LIRIATAMLDPRRVTFGRQNIKYGTRNGELRSDVVRHSTFNTRYSTFDIQMTEITARLSTAVSDRYKIERRLGEGGMATVYLAHDLKHDRKVALKVLRPELAAGAHACYFLR
jgi:serine/threonine protein kinase